MIKLYFSSKKTSNLKQLLLIFLTLLIICKIATTKHAFIPHDNEQFISALCKAYKRLSGVCDLFSISNIFIFCCVFRQILIIVEFLSFFVFCVLLGMLAFLDYIFTQTHMYSTVCATKIYYVHLITEIFVVYKMNERKTMRKDGDFESGH